MKYSPSNGTEFEMFLERNCYRCRKFDKEMMYNRDVNTCDILFKILDQRVLSEEDAPDIYEFEDGVFNDECPPECLKKEVK